MFVFFVVIVLTLASENFCDDTSELIASASGGAMGGPDESGMESDAQASAVASIVSWRPKPTLRCKKNEILKKCRTICPPQFCNISFTDFACDPIKKCEKGCDCIKNYLRNDNGICIPNNKCFSGPRPNLCPENEVYKECRTICQPQWCNISFISFAPCGENPKCEPGCDCVQNYLRDLKGICIPTEKCLSSEPECGKYQEKSDCADYYSAEPQITLCRPGCRCIKGYIRNSQNECVPICGKNEEASDCKQVCPPLNCNWDPTKMACKPGPCQAGCNCIKGYLKNNQDVCIPQEQCPKKCGKNEEASDCKQVCPPLDCDWDPTKMACKPGPCQAGCNCIKGYLKNNQGVCIPQEQCPIKCPENEEPTDCAKNLDPNQSTLTIKCRPCQCIENFVRNSDGVCVSKDELCDGDRNTTYTQCPNRCTSTCKNPNGICTKSCPEGYGCGCKPGYLYSDDRKCILPQDCPGGNSCKDNQTFVYCNAGCPTDNCPENDNQGEIACDPPYPCASGCACKRNYKWLNNEREKCVLASECPPVKCTRKNEIWAPCSSRCFSDKCRDQGTSICSIAIGGQECKPQCVCEKGYRRNDLGICVPISECPPQCGKNEVPTECAVDYPQILAKDDAIAERIRCLPGCKCIDGYTKVNGVCTPISRCGINEEPNDCPIIFYPQPQPDLFVVASTEKIRCKPCRCINGYEYSSSGVCVPISRCGKNEEPNICPIILYSQPQPDILVVESTENIRCKPCRCIKGYEYSSSGVCVPISRCGINEEPNICPLILNPRAEPDILVVESTEKIRCKPCRCIKGYEYSSSGVCVPISRCGINEEPNDCSIVSFPQPQPDILVVESTEKIRCKPCRCIKGYEYSSTGVCVPISRCGKYEEPNDCPIILYSQPQPDILVVESTEKIRCKPCRCIKGYEYSSSGVCVPISRCGINEEPNICPIILYPQPQPDILVVESTETIRCKPCRCIKGYEYSSSGVCVPISRCGINEEPNDCSIVSFPQPQPDILVVESTEKIRCKPCRCIKGYEYSSSGVCVPSQCGEFEEVNFCIQIFPNNGCPRCRCIPNYIRDESGKCVPEDTLCKGDPNTTYKECPNRCQSTCKNPEAICTEKCEPNGCECKFGYIKNDDGKCVLPQDCPGGSPCGYNQTYVACKFGCPTNYCPRDDTLAQVACLPAYPCPGGCACKRNYLLASEKDQRCILGSECAPFKCTRKNEIYNSCPGPCFSENCGDVEVVTCNTLLPHVCRPRCVCQKGYQRSFSTGECIPIRTCDNNPSIDVYRQ